MTAIKSPRVPSRSQQSALWCSTKPTELRSFHLQAPGNISTGQKAKQRPSQASSNQRTATLLVPLLCPPKKGTHDSLPVTQLCTSTIHQTLYISASSLVSRRYADICTDTNSSFHVYYQAATINGSYDQADESTVGFLGSKTEHCEFSPTNSLTRLPNVGPTPYRFAVSNSLL